ncbi:MAG: histidine phosphatase family protein [Aquificae bacterium]|nr:histidine phosphatase family protein [Aquificota bacterium]
MLKLFVIRHAESEWNPVGRYQGLLDPDLSERGVKQAELLAKALKGEGISALFSSPLTRTLKTAKIIGKELGLEPVVDERLREIDHGEWSGLLVDEVKERFPEDFEKWLKEPHEVKFPKGESLREVFERVQDFLRFLLENYNEKTVALVSHTVPIRCLYCAVLGIDLSKFWSFGCDNASYSVVYLDNDGRNVLQKLNITCHLGDLYVEAHKAL